MVKILAYGHAKFNRVVDYVRPRLSLVHFFHLCGIEFSKPPFKPFFVHC